MTSHFLLCVSFLTAMVPGAKITGVGKGRKLPFDIDALTINWGLGVLFVMPSLSSKNI